MQCSPGDFDKSSPAPNMYDTSTSTADTHRGGSGGGGGESSGPSHSGPEDQQRQQQLHTQRKPSSKSHSKPPSTNKTRSGNFKSQAALLSSSSNYYSHPSPQHPSPSRTPTNKYAANDSASDIPGSPGEGKFASAASQYISSQQLHQQHPSKFKHHARSDHSASSRPRDGTSVTEMSSAPTIATQSEPGAASYGNYSYYTLTDQYSSSTAPSPERRRFSSRFAAMVESRIKSSNNNYSFSQQDAEPQTPTSVYSSNYQQQQQQQQQQREHHLELMNFPLSPADQPLQQQNRHHPQLQQLPHGNPFIPNRVNAQPPFSQGKPMSVSERIRKFGKTYPDPEPVLTEEEDDDNPQLGQSKQLAPFHVQPRNTTTAMSTNSHSSSVGEEKKQQPEEEQCATNQATNHNHFVGMHRRHGTRVEAAAAAREAVQASRNYYVRDDTNYNNNNNQGAKSTSGNAAGDGANHHSSEFAPDTATRPSRSDQPNANNNNNSSNSNNAVATRERPSTSLPPVRRRKPLQQPAYNNSQTEHEQQNLNQQEAEPAVSIGSPVRIQELKQQLWDKDERLNVSMDQSEGSAPRRAARSLSPRQYRFSSESNSNAIQVTAPSNTMLSPSGNIGGFKSKFYQAAMAAQRGERTVTPPKSRSMKTDNIGSSGQQPYSSKDMPGTPPRASSTRSNTNHLVQNYADANPDRPTPPRGGGMHPMEPMPPTPPHHSHASNVPITPEGAGQPPLKKELAALQHPSLQPPTSRQPQQHRLPPHYHHHGPQNSSQQRHSHQQQHFQPENDQSGPVTNEDKKTIAELLAKLNAVSRDDPQAALAQIDSILRAESGSNHGSGDQQLLAQQAMLMNAAAEGRMTPQQQEHIQQLYSQQAFPANASFPDRQNQPTHCQEPQNPNENENGDDDDESSDDETSVSSITDPTYMSSKPTHEQLHDMPPAHGLSTATYRRPRPSALQGYNTHGPSSAVAGLELVQHHHQRQLARKDRYGRPYNHYQHHPPSKVNVNDNANNSGQRIAADDDFLGNNLISTRTKNRSVQQMAQQQPQFYPTVHSNSLKEQHQSTQQAHQSHNFRHDQATIKQHQQNVASKLQEQQRHMQHGQAEAFWKNVSDKHLASNEKKDTARIPVHDIYGFPAFEYSASIENKEREEHQAEGEQQDATKPNEERPPQFQQPQQQNQQQQEHDDVWKSSKGLLPRHPRDSSEKRVLPKPGKTNNPFDDSIDTDNKDNVEDGHDAAKPGIKVGGRERKLDLFMSRKKKKEEGELLQLLGHNESKAQLSGDVLAQKIRTWDELSNQVSKVSTKGSAEGPGKNTLSSQVSATASSRAGSEREPANGEAPVNTSIEAMSSGTVSAMSRSSRRTHPWDSDDSRTRLDIDCRDTSMDNALGVEAEYFSQSQISPSRDLRRAARMQHQQLAASEAKRTQQQREEADKILLSQVSPGRELRKERLARAAMQQHHDKKELARNDENIDEAMGQKSPVSENSRLSNATHDEQEQQETGFEVTPIYAAEEKGNCLRSSSDEYGDNWVAVPSNSFFKPFKKSSNSKIVASLVDQDTQPVTMVRTPAPELPMDVADAFADVPIPYDEHPSNVDSQLRSSDRGRDRHIIDVSGMEEVPPPVVPSEASNRGRRAFSNFLKKRASSRKRNSSAHSPSPIKNVSMTTRETSDKDDAPSCERRTASTSPSRHRSRSLDDTGRIRNPNIAKKFSRLLKVYGNDISDDEKVHL